MRAPPAPHHLLHTLLQSGVLKVCAARLKELDFMLSNRNKANALKASFRRSHMSMQVSVN